MRRREEKPWKCENPLYSQEEYLTYSQIHNQTMKKAFNINNTNKYIKKNENLRECREKEDEKSPPEMIDNDDFLLF